MGNKTEYYIHGVNGPVIKVRGGRSLPRMSLVYVGCLLYTSPSPRD